jgi:hypothetical protein
VTKKEFDKRKTEAIHRLVAEHVEAVENIEQHTYEQCSKDEHLWESHATGGRGGHCVSTCEVCGHSVEGWD